MKGIELTSERLAYKDTMDNPFELNYVIFADNPKIKFKQNNCNET